VSHARRALDRHPEQRVTERRVRETRTRLAHERVVFEDLQGGGEAVVMRRSFTLAGLVMSNAAEMSEQLPGRDRVRLGGEARRVLLYGRVEIQLSALGELHRSGRRQRFRDRGDAKNRGRLCWHPV